MSDRRRDPVRPDRVRTIPPQFSWIDRSLLHRGFLEDLSRDEMALYFFLVLVSGPEGTSFWSPRRVAEWLGLSLEELIEALRGLLKADLVAYHYPTFQVLSLPERTER
jgi:hypothetical protein